MMRRVFYLVGPTAAGKSELAAEVAQRIGAEIVSADAFQIYRGFALLSAKPDAATMSRARHHLIGEVDPADEMNAAKFARRADEVIREINARNSAAIVAGGTGLYVRALTDGLSPLPEANAELREELNAMSTEELAEKLQALDPASAVDWKNRRRVIRAIEISVATGRPASTLRSNVVRSPRAAGVFVFREREELYGRIDQRVEEMFAKGVVDEVRDVTVGATASQMLGLAEIRRFLAGEISRAECIANIQQATRRYAKRQLTWFRRQTNFEPLNLSECTTAEAVEWIAQKARLSFAHD